MGLFDESEGWVAIATANANQSITVTGTTAVNASALPFGPGVYLEITCDTDCYFAEVDAAGTVTSAGRRYRAGQGPVYIRSSTGYVAFLRVTNSGTAYISTIKVA